MSTFLDFAIGLSLVNGISGEINKIVGDFKRLNGVTDDVIKQLDGLKNISITGGILAGAGVAGLKMTADAISDCISEAEKLQTTSNNLKIKAFGKDILDESKLPEIQAQMEELEKTAMNISLGTMFNQQQIEESMISMVKGGMSVNTIRDSTAAANAYFAQINETNPIATADATVKFVTGFHLQEDQIKESLDLITKYANATPTDALQIQQNIGNISGSATTVWKGRDNLEIAEETLQLITSSATISGGEASAATNARNFLDEANHTFNLLTEKEIEMMTDAGWLTNPVYEKAKNGKMKLTDAQSIFIDYDTGRLKDVAELEKILEDTAQKMTSTDFSNLLEQVFGDRGKKTAAALAQVGGGEDISFIKQGVNSANGIDTQVEMQMNTAAAQAGIMQEAINTIKTNLGKPFLEGKTEILKGVNAQLKILADYISENPQVIKYATAVMVGVSSFLALAGGIMMAVGTIQSLKIVMSIAGPQIAAYFTPILPVLGVVTAAILVVAGLAYVIYRNWNTIKPQFESIFNRIKEILSIAKQKFKFFKDEAVPIIQNVFGVFEKGVMLIANIALPIIDTALLLFVSILDGSVLDAISNVWNGLSPLSRILLLVLSPSIAIVTGLLIMMASKMLVNTAIAIGSAIATKGVAIATSLYNGVLGIATFIQGAWNIAMGTGTALTIGQKIAVAALIPFMLLAKGAQAAWTGVQWLLNIAMDANPIGVVILLIGAFIGVVVLTVTHLKELTEWLNNAWEKLKGFLGFKKEHEDELQNVEMNITETQKIEKEITISPDIEIAENNLSLLPKDYINSITLNPEVLISPDVQTSSDSLESITSFLPEEYTSGVALNPEVSISPDVQMSSDSLESIISSLPEEYTSGMALSPEVSILPDYSVLQGQIPEEFMQQLGTIEQTMGDSGTEAASKFAEAIGSDVSISLLNQSVGKLNDTIKNSLVTPTQMYSWGDNLIQSFINGMNSKKTELTTAAQELSTIVGDYLKVQSPSRKGDLKTNHLWGGNLIQSFVDGMKNKNSDLTNTVSLISNTIGKMQSNNEYENDMGFKLNSISKKRDKSDDEKADKKDGNIYIIIQGNDKDSNTIAQEVAKELKKRGYGKKRTNTSLTMSPFGYSGGF